MITSRISGSEPQPVMRQLSGEVLEYLQDEAGAYVSDRETMGHFVRLGRLIFIGRLTLPLGELGKKVGTRVYIGLYNAVLDNLNENERLSLWDYRHDRKFKQYPLPQPGDHLYDYGFYRVVYVNELPSLTFPLEGLRDGADAFERLETQELANLALNGLYNVASI